MRNAHILRSAVSISLLSLAVVSWAATKADKHPIDIWYEQAINKEYSTVGMREAANEARDKWDKEMNKVYARLMARLDKKKQELLREAQRAWLKYRDAENKALSDIVAAQDGTMWQLTATTKGMELVRERALQLQAYEDALSKK